MDGWITIGTKLDTKDLEKDLKTAESKMKQYNKEAEKLSKQKAKIDLDLSAYEEEKKKIKEATDLTLKKAQTEEQVREVLETEALEVNKLKDKYAETFKNSENINKSISEVTNKQGILNSEIQEMNVKLKQSKGLNNIKDSLNKADGAMSRILKKVAKWGLAIFSVRSAYMFVRQAISTISQYNTQIGTDIEYIRYALAMTLQPVVERIINLAHKLLSYIGYIAKAWFGVDLWANSSAENFKKAKDRVSGISKEAKKLQKQLSGFDEMNILQENGSTSTGGGGGGTTLPSFNLDNKDIKPPWWVDWIANNKDTIITIAKVIGGLFGASKIAKMLGNIGLLFGTTGGKGLLGLLSTLGKIALIAGGIIITGYF